MREIKFRGYSCAMEKWYYGSLVCLPAISDDTCAVCDIMDEEGSRHPVSKVGQFTGLHDRNGKEIYEGDFVEYTYTSRRGRGYKPQEHTEKGYIVYREQEAGFVLVLPKSDICVGEIFCKCINVIGNIFDNPELLEGGEK